MDEMDKDWVEEPHQDVQDKEKDESSNSIGHEDYHPIWLEDGTLLVFHWALKFSFKTPLEGKSFSTLIGFWRTRRPWIRRKDFHNFHWTKRTSSKRGDQKLGKEEFLGGLFLLWFSWEREEKDEES